MPRANITPLIQKIARQAHVTFKGCGSVVDPDKQQLFLEKQGELLNALVNAVRAADLKIVPRNNKKTGQPTMVAQQQKQEEDPASAPGPAPGVTYMHICETDTFSMGVFLLSGGGVSIPLHDHPGMHGMLKVLYGKVSIRCFDLLDVNGVERPRFDPPVPDSQTAHLRRVALRSEGVCSQDSGPCVLTPQRHNIHQIEAVDGAAAFLDILAPPYDPDDGRDCHYYRVLKTLGAVGSDEGKKKKQQREQGVEEVAAEGEKEIEGGEEIWLLKIPQPEDFWCGGEPYPGPAVDL